ncbi:MAG: dephospho-CoA kinase [Balneolales bacterium]
MITIGITGGIGSGKTTVCKHWESLGAQVIYADALAKELMVKKPELINAIKREFGEDSYYEDGSLNKDYLSRQAFELGKVDRLNQLVHPEVYKETGRIIDEAEQAGIKVLVKEAALLLLKGRPKNLDHIVLVLADEQLRTVRVALRDPAGPEDIKKRIRKQQDFSKLTHLADSIIENNGDLKELLQKADDIYQMLLNKA